MDNAISQIFHACGLARELEASLPNLASGHPSILKSTLEEVVVPFNNAIHELDMLLGGGHQGQRPMDFFSQGPPIKEQIASVEFGIGSSNISTGQEVASSFEMVIPEGGVGGGAEVQAAGAGVEGSSRRPGSGSTGQRQSRKRYEFKARDFTGVFILMDGNFPRMCADVDRETTWELQIKHVFT